MSDTPAPQTVAIRLVEEKALTNPKDCEPVHLEFTLQLNPPQREVFNIITYYTKNNSPLRTHLMGLFLAYGASTALNELRKVFPTSTLEMSSVNKSLYGRS